MQKMQRRFLPLALAALTSGVLADDDIFFAELPVVASVSRLPQRQADAPASVTVVDREMIRASGVRSLSDIFRLVPGFQTFAQSDTTSRVTYHGITDDNDYSPRVQVLVDGRSLHSPLFRGGVNWALLPVALEDIERIEVVRGSNSVSYGTNAFLGVVNIITVDPSLVRGTAVSTSLGSQGVRDYTVRGGGGWENGNYRLTYQEVKDDGLEDAYDWQDSNRVRRLDARLDYQLTDKDALELNLGRVEGRFTKGRLDFDEPAPHIDTGNPMRNLDESSSWLQMRWLHTLGADADFSLRYTFSEDRSDETFSDPGRAIGYQRVNEGGDWGQRHELEATHHFSPMRATRLVWGASWRHDTLSSDTMMRDRGQESRQVWRAFANGEWKPVTWLTANAGMSNEYDSLAGNHLSPRASLAFHLDAENTLRIGYARAWRTSSILAYKANYRHDVVVDRDDQIGNPRLPAERLDSWEIAYLGDWRSLRMSLDLRGFDERIRDRLMLVRPGVAYSGDIQYSEQSIQDLKIRGYELQWKWTPRDGTQLLLNYARIHITSEWSDNGKLIALSPGSHLFLPVHSNKYVALAENSAPRNSSSAMLIQRLPNNWQLSVVYSQVGAMQWTRNTEVDRYQRVDARLAYPFSLGGKPAEIAYTVQSLNGAHIEQRKSDDDPKARVVDRRQWLTLNVSF